MEVIIPEHAIMQVIEIPVPGVFRAVLRGGPEMGDGVRAFKNIPVIIPPGNGIEAYGVVTIDIV